MRKSGAFTIVEIIITITIIAILSSIAIITFNSVRQDSRNAARQGNATIVSEALEKYYEQNGEYPSVASIANNQPTNTGSAVASKLSIPPASLTMPNMPSGTTNAIAPGTEPQNDYLAYEATSAENNLGCQNDVNAGCDTFRLRYLEEGTDQIKVITSRHAWRSTSSAPELAVSATGPGSIDAVWTEMPNATSYTLQRSLSHDMSSPTTTTHSSTSTTITGLAVDTEYFFSVRATTSNGMTDWSEVESATTSGVTTPIGTITIAAAMSGTNARGTAGGGSCSGGTTIEYQIRHRVNGGAWNGWVSGTPRDVAATQGSSYTFQAQARCKTGSVGGPWALSTTASVTYGVSAPTGLTITAAMSGTSARGTAGGGSCGAGTTIERQIRYQVNGGAWTAYTTGTPRDVPATAGYQYTFQQQARCVGTSTSSGWATSSTAAVVRPLPTPSAPGLKVSTSGSTSTWTATGSCPAGTTVTYQRRSLQQGGAWTGWEGTSTSGVSTWNTAAQGYTYSRQARIQCNGAYASSAWSAQSPTVSYTRPIIVPQATGWSHVSLGWQHESNCKYYSSCKWRRYTWTAPTCPAGTTYHSSRWNSYVGTKMSWDNGQGQAYRWWHGYSTGSTTNDSLAYSSPQNSHIIEYSSNVPTNYDDVKHKLIWTCRNNVTGNVGSTEMHSPTFRYM